MAKPVIFSYPDASPYVKKISLGVELNRKPTLGVRHESKGNE